MKSFKIAFVALATLIFVSAKAQEAKKWNIDNSHASVQFSIDHFFSAVSGKFKAFDGNVHFDPNNLKGSKVSFTVNVKSVDTGEPDRDEHLQSEDFFNAAKWPTMKFVSSRFEKTGENKYTAYGKLTIRDVTKDVALPFVVKGVIDNPWKEGAVIMGISLSTTINRTDYGVGTGSWAATAVVSDDVAININMELDGEK